MRLLLDTHVWLWMVSRPERLSTEALGALEDADNELYLSAASCWELSIKYVLGKLPLPEPPETFVLPRLARDGVRGLAVQPFHGLRVCALPLHHRDPFDRILVAQAQLEELTLVTADHALMAYDVAILRA